MQNPCRLDLGCMQWQGETWVCLPYIDGECSITEKESKMCEWAEWFVTATIICPAPHLFSMSPPDNYFSQLPSVPLGHMTECVYGCQGKWFVPLSDRCFCSWFVFSTFCLLATQLGIGDSKMVELLQKSRLINKSRFESKSHRRATQSKSSCDVIKK